MKVKRFKAENFRNIEKCDIEFTDGVNLIYGGNALGKTNVIEGIYLFSRGRSFRTAQEKDMVKYNTQGFRIALEYDSRDGECSLEYANFGREKRRRKNGYTVKSVREMIEGFKAILFHPDDLSLVKGGPEERRAFLNVAAAQCYPAYISDYSRFQTALENRNALLKNASKGLYVDEGELLAWSESMAEYAAYIYETRSEYLKKLEVYVKEIGFKISGGKEEISFEYKSDIEIGGDRESVKEEYSAILRNSVEKEKIVGTSLYGPQRDDIIIKINNQPTRGFASQGQQRSIVLSMKLAEGEVIRDMFGEYPVFLLDEMLSELDETRRRFVLDSLEGKQTVITACECEEMKPLANNLIQIKEGRYVSAYR
ncbi:MAG: DNA replication/repair protein RecF [Clostridia bacterium]|nr:DNA replication/repair protein RecF [Clostridia bacterium]